MGLLALQHMAAAAFLSSLRNMISEFAIRHGGAADVQRILSSWSFEAEARSNWDRHHLLVDQMPHSGQHSSWSHQAFLALPQLHTQNKLQQLYSNSQLLQLLLLVDQCKAIKLMSAAGTGAAAFLHAPEMIPGYMCSLQLRIRTCCEITLGSTRSP